MFLVVRAANKLIKPFKNPGYVGSSGISDFQFYITQSSLRSLDVSLALLSEAHKRT